MVLTGLDQPDKLRRYKKSRIGLLAHAASVNKNLVHAVDVLLQKKFALTALFGPEHGLWATAQDMIAVGQARDARTGLPVVSLYGDSFESLTPTAQDLGEVDVLICDLQDVGSRYYTYACTAALCLKACARDGKKLVVLDRPNPLSGVVVEGPGLQPGFESFVGLFSVPVRHGMTLAELVLLYAQQEELEDFLEIVPMKGWKRSMTFDQTGLPWVLPSPNMPTLETAFVYPGMCLIEATEISEGRGTTRPFELVGAPFIDAHELSKALTALKLPGVVFRPVYFHPTYQKHAGKDCGGVQLHVTNRKMFQSYLTGVAVLKTIHDLYPNDFKWREKPYEFVTEIAAIDLLSGDGRLRQQIENKESFQMIRKNLCPSHKNHSAEQKAALIYR